MSINLKAQQIKKTGSNEPTYKILPYEKLRPQISDYPLALAKYDKSLRAKKTSRILFISAGGATVASFAAPLIDEALNPGQFCDLICTGGFILIVGIIIVVPSILVAGLVTKIVFNRRKNKTLQLFNEGRADLGGFDKLNGGSEIHFSFQSTSNGAGFLLAF